MTILYLAAAYCILRGATSMMGKSYFFTQRALEKIAPEHITPYLKESGIYMLLVGIVFFVYAKNIISLWPYIIALIALGFLLNRCNEKYLIKET